MRKTVRMQLLEAQHGGRDVRELMREAFSETGSREKAAVRLGISSVAFRDWERLLGINVAESVPVP